MATLHQITASNAVEITDQEQVENLLKENDISAKHRLEDNTLRFYGYVGFRVYNDEGDLQGKYNGVPKFLHELKQYIAEGDELVIHGIGNAKLRFPLLAYKFRATPEAVYYSDLDQPEEEIEVEQ